MFLGTLSPAAVVADEEVVVRALLELPTLAEGEMVRPDGPAPAQVEAGETVSPLTLLSYWAGEHLEAEPSAATRRALLLAVRERPEWLPGILRRLPPDVETVETVKALYDLAVASDESSDGWKQGVFRWLMFNSEYFRRELIEAAGRADDHDEGGVLHELELVSLAERDWATAEPLLTRLVAEAGPRTRTLVSTLRYRRALATGQAAEARRLRSVLAAIGTDVAAPGYARDRALEALLASEWSGRDEWYLSLFADPTLIGLRDGHRLMRPLTGPVRADPERWVPEMVDRVGSEDRAVHDHAVQALMALAPWEIEPDALRPLVPWLDDPDWSSASDLLTLVQSFGLRGVEEAVPGLVRMVESGHPFAEWAGEALGRLRAPAAAPGLRQLLTRELAIIERTPIIRALLACGGIRTAEQLAALHAFSARVVVEGGDHRYGWLLFRPSGEVPLAVSIGAELSRHAFEPSPELVSAAIDSLPELDRRSPGAAGVLRRIMARWNSPLVDRLLVADLAAGRAEAEAVSSLLARRREVVRRGGPEVDALLSLAGLPRGVGVVLVEDERAVGDVLGRPDALARAGLLAAARLVGDELPIDAVGALLRDPGPLVGRAAEAYLEASDTRPARELLWEHHAGEARVLGSRPPYPPGHSGFEVFDEWEQALRREVLADDGPDEIYALLAVAYFGGPGQRVIRIRDGRGRLACDGSRRELTVGELAGLADFVAAHRIDDLSRLDTGAHDGVQYEYVHLTRRGGRRIFMNNPGLEAGSPHAVLTARMLELGCP